MLPGSVSCCPALALNCGKAAPLSMLEAGHLPLATAWLQVLGNRGYLGGVPPGATPAPGQPLVLHSLQMHMQRVRIGDASCLIDAC